MTGLIHYNNIDEITCNQTIKKDNVEASWGHIWIYTGPKEEIKDEIPDWWPCQCGELRNDEKK